MIRQRAEARGELIADMLPALDGLERALDHGHLWLEQRRQQAVQAAHARVLNRPQPQGVWHKLRHALVGEPRSIELPVVSGTADDNTADTLEAWLQGLELVRERFLSLLASEGIQPIPALGQPFDPRLHVAMETELRSDVSSGVIVKVLRKGYRQQDRVLRYAEVVVARALDVQASASPAQAVKSSGERFGEVTGTSQVPVT
jgi:molecular chaperone GrpE (heat shock protein)